MLELPEVETIVRELRTKISNEVFSEFEPIWPGSFVVEDGLNLEKNQIRDISRKGKFILLRVTMTKQSAIKYLKLLHKLEKKYTQNLFTTDLKALAKKLRKEFITAYKK